MSMTEQFKPTIKSLEQLIYDVRDIIGDVKDCFIKKVSNKVPCTLNSKLLSDYVDKKILVDSKNKLWGTLGEIANDGLIQEYAKRKDPELKTDTNATIMMIQDYVAILDSGLTTRELPILSSLGETLHDALYPIAVESREYDHLTRLYLKKSFHTELEKNIKRYMSNPAIPLSVAFIDVNNLKIYNDSNIDHLQGDEMLRQLAQIMNSDLSGIKGRLGGDEIGIEMEGVDAEGMAVILSDRFLKPLDLYLVDNIKKIYGKNYNPKFDAAGRNITCSVGITSTALNGTSLLERVCERIHDNTGVYALLKKQIHKGIDAGLPEKQLYQTIYNSTDFEKIGMSPEELTDLLASWIDYTLIKESDSAMYSAKNETKKWYAEKNEDIHKIAVYAPKKKVVHAQN